MPSTSPLSPTVADLTDFVLSAQEAREDAADWQKPALDEAIDDLFDLILEQDRYDFDAIRDDYDGDDYNDLADLDDAYTPGCDDGGAW